MLNFSDFCLFKFSLSHFCNACYLILVNRYDWLLLVSFIEIHIRGLPAAEFKGVFENSLNVLILDS
jgi:hypothetical protein